MLCQIFHCRSHLFHSSYHHKHLLGSGSRSPLKGKDPFPCSTSEALPAMSTLPFPLKTSSHQRSCSAGSLALRKSGQGVEFNELSVLVDRLLVDLAKRRGQTRAGTTQKPISVVKMAPPAAVVFPVDSGEAKTPSDAGQVPEPSNGILQKQKSMPALPHRSSSLYQNTVRARVLTELEKGSHIRRPRNPPPMPSILKVVADSPLKKKLPAQMVLADGTEFTLVSATPATRVEHVDSSRQESPTRQRKSTMLDGSSKSSPTPTTAKEPSSPISKEERQQSDTLNSEALTASTTSSPGSQHSSNSPTNPKSSNSGGSTSGISTDAMQVKRMDEKAISGPMSASLANNATFMTGGFRFPTSPPGPPSVHRARNRRSASVNAATLSSSLGNVLNAPKTPAEEQDAGEDIFSTPMSTPRSLLSKDVSEPSSNAPCQSRFSWTTNGSPPEHASASALNQREKSDSVLKKVKGAPVSRTNENVSALGKFFFRKRPSKMSLREAAQQQQSLPGSKDDSLHNRRRSYTVQQPVSANPSRTKPSLSSAAIALAKAYQPPARKDEDQLPSSPSSPLGTPFWSGNHPNDTMRSQSATPSGTRRASAWSDAQSRLETRTVTPESSLRSRLSVNFGNLPGSRRSKLWPAALALDEEIEVLEEHTDFVPRGSWISDDDPRTPPRSPIQKWQEEIIRKGPQQQSSVDGSGRWQRMRQASLKFLRAFGDGDEGQDMRRRVSMCVNTKDT